MAISNKLKTCLIIAGMIILAGCGSDSSDKTTPTTPAIPPVTPAQTTVKVFDTVANCSSVADVPSCHFENGVYVLKLGSVTDAQQQRVIKRVSNMMQWAHQDVRDQFAGKRIIIGLIENEAALMASEEEPSAIGKFVMALNKQKSDGLTIDGIELIYTAIEEDGEEIDETMSPTTYQKMMQLYDYYVDGNTNSLPGAALSVSYNAFKDVLLQSKTAAEGMGIAYLQYDECSYGNGQLSTVASERALGTPTPCKTGKENDKTTDDDDNDISNGKLDETHSLAVNLNPGALLGTVYEYQIEANLNTAAGELLGSDGNDFVDEGNIGSASNAGLTDKDKLFVSWANPAFLPLKQYLDTYFFVNKK